MGASRILHSRLRLFLDLRACRSNSPEHSAGCRRAQLATPTIPSDRWRGFRWSSRATAGRSGIEDLVEAARRAVATAPAGKGTPPRFLKNSETTQHKL